MSHSNYNNINNYEACVLTDCLENHPVIVPPIRKGIWRPTIDFRIISILCFNSNSNVSLFTYQSMSELLSKWKCLATYEISWFQIIFNCKNLLELNIKTQTCLHDTNIFNKGLRLTNEQYQGIRRK